MSGLVENLWGWEHYIMGFEQTIAFQGRELRSFLPLLVQVALEKRTDELDRLREMIEVRDLLASNELRDQIDEYSKEQKRYLAEVLTFVTHLWLAGTNQEVERAMNDAVIFIEEGLSPKKARSLLNCERGWLEIPK